ncbi:uncharacterized protein LOC123988263 [Osmia bicornis bicornis]|uniref:uncharacterized protein LOC123988263 n=1 Tax=Osmia bicornis bicornis TaxID=1437191 RepID=UPI001EAEB2F4|nr:uncharacterized protein LOC123988263 [Osmia bicornis bicornis]
MPRISDQSANQTQSTSHNNLSILRRKRGNIIGHITTLARFIDNLQQSEQRDIGLLRAHIDSLKDVWARFDDIQFDIEAIDESETARRYEIHNDYVTVVARANSLIEGENAIIPSRRSTTDSPASSVSAPMAIKLPEMRLPTFDGRVENWTTYFDSFVSMIDQNADLTPVQKLQYLRSTLTGKAAACIRSLSTTDANYADAIDLLKNKFECKRRALLKHCDAIQAIPKLSADSPEALGDLVDTVRQNLRSLKNLGIDTSSWDCIIISIVLSKINSDTAWHWELSLKDKQMPPCTHLLDFLEKRANCKPATQKKSSTSPGQSSRHRSTKSINPRYPMRSHAFVTATNSKDSQDHRKPYTAPAAPANFSKCPVCQEVHAIWRCEKFHALSVEARTAIIRRTSLCPNCLRQDHNSETCKRMLCRICNKYHHTLLHQSRQLSNRAAPPPPKRARTTDSQILKID